MSVLAELEELRRCLEGSADSDSDETDSPAVLIAHSELSKMGAEPSLAECSSENSSVVEDAGYVTAGEFLGDVGQSAANSDKIESFAQVSKSQTSSSVSVNDKGFASEVCGQEQETTSTCAITVKGVSSDSGMLLPNSSKDSANVKVCKDKILTVSSTEEDSSSKNIKVLTLKQNDDEVLSLDPEDVKMLTCKVPNILTVNKDVLSAVSLPTNISKVDRGAQASESKVLPISSLALTNEGGLIVKKVKPGDENNANSSSHGIVEEPSLKLQVGANRPTRGSVMLKLLSSRVKTCPSESDFVANNKTKCASSDVQQPSSTTKAFEPCLNIMQGRKSDFKHTSKDETVGKVQPACDSPISTVDSKVPRQEEVKVSNGRPVIRILEVSSDSKKTKSETYGVSENSSASLLVISSGNVTREGRHVSSPPVVMKRNISFETGQAAGHVLGEKHPPVSVDTSKRTKPEEPETSDARSDIKKRKLSTETGPLSINTATSQQAPKDKFSFMSSQIQKMGLNKQISPKKAEPKLPDVGIKEIKVCVYSESMLPNSTGLGHNLEGEHLQELCPNLGLDERICLEASTPVAAKRNFDAQPLSKRRASTDAVEVADRSESGSCPASGVKRRKLSAPEVTELAGKETLNSESNVPNSGSVKVARSLMTKTVPITSTMEVIMSPHGVEQNVQTVPVSKSEEHRLNGDDLAMEKEDPGRKLMEARVILKKLKIPIPEHLLPLPVQNKEITNTKPQSLHETLEKVSMVLQATMAERSAMKKRKVGKPKKLQDHVVEPIKEQKVMKRPTLQHKIIAKSAKQKIMGKQAQQKIMGSPSQRKIMKKSSQHKFLQKSKHQNVTGKPPQQNTVVKLSQYKSVEKSKHQNVMGKPPQQKHSGKAKQQKSIRKPIQQKSVSKQKTTKKTLPANLPSIAVRIGAKKKKKKVMPKKVVSSKNKTKMQKVGPSVIAKKTVRQISFGNLKYQQNVNLAVNQRPEDKKRKVVTRKEKNVTLNKSKQNKSDSKEKTVVSKMNTNVSSLARGKEVMPVETKVKLSAVKATETFQQKNLVAMKKQLETKEVFTVARTTKNTQQIPIEPCKPDGDDTTADDEWIVEVLLDDSELDMMAVISQMQVGQDTNVSKVSSSDDRPKDLDVSSSNLDMSHSLECDSSTDTNSTRKTAVVGGKQVRRTISASKSETGRTFVNMNVKPRTALPYVKRVTSSVNRGERSGISVEQKMAEMRKAIGDLERIADRSMLRLKAEERQVIDLTNKLQQYENDKHHRMLRKILRDGAPGPKQNPDAMFILDLILSYCPEDDASDSS